MTPGTGHDGAPPAAVTRQAVLRQAAAALGGALPPLVAQAERLAATLLVGEHGRRRAGLGDAFWQYRPARPDDPARGIDWRRSARGDGHFVREKEWQAAQSVMFWLDPAQSMGFSGDSRRPAKADLAAEVALATAMLLLRGGERAGLLGRALPPRGGMAQAARIAELLVQPPDPQAPDYGRPVAEGLPDGSRAVFLSDFLGDMAGVEAALDRASAHGVRGALLQVLDPDEEAFPYDGRTIFESMSGALRHETLRAGDLRQRYLDRLAARKDRLRGLARAAGWQYHTHHTGKPAQSALLWLFGALGQGR